MRKSKFSETQIIRLLKEAETGKSVREICREHRISIATSYRWQSLYGGMEVSELARLKELEQENRPLKQMFADTSLENKIMKEVIDKSSDADGEAGTGRLCHPRHDAASGRQHSREGTRSKVGSDCDYG